MLYEVITSVTVVDSALEPNERGALNRVLQFPDISWPIVRKHQCSCLIIDPLDRLSKLPVVVIQEELQKSLRRTDEEMASAVTDVITSYSIHYTKLYDQGSAGRV